MTKRERTALIQLMSNVDDIVAALPIDKRELLDKSIQKAYSNYHSLLEGLPDAMPDM